MLLFSSSSKSGSASFASTSLLIGFTGVPTDGYIPVDHVTNMAAGWRQMLRRYVDSHFRPRAADKIFDVIAHNYDRWDEKSGAFLTGRRHEFNESEQVEGHEVSGGQKTVTQKSEVRGHEVTSEGHEPDSRQSREIAGELLADSQLAAPTIRLARLHARCSQGQQRRQHSGDTYLYYFNDTGVTHDLLTYIFGAPLSPGIDPFHPGSYTNIDRQLAVDVIKRWANFIHSGRVIAFDTYYIHHYSVNT